MFISKTLLVAVSAAIAASPLAFAQAAPAAAEEIIVTGSRIVRDGYGAPTAVSVPGPEDEHHAIAFLQRLIAHPHSIPGHGASHPLPGREAAENLLERPSDEPPLTDEGTTGLRRLGGSAGATTGRERGRAKSRPFSPALRSR